MCSKKSEIRDYAKYGGNFLARKSEIRDYASYGGKFFRKNLKLVITAGLRIFLAK